MFDQKHLSAGFTPLPTPSEASTRDLTGSIDSDSESDEGSRFSRVTSCHAHQGEHELFTDEHRKYWGLDPHIPSPLKKPGCFAKGREAIRRGGKRKSGKTVNPQRIKQQDLNDQFFSRVSEGVPQGKRDRLPKVMAQRVTDMWAMSEGDGGFAQVRLNLLNTGHIFSWLAVRVLYTTEMLGTHLPNCALWLLFAVLCALLTVALRVTLPVQSKWRHSDAQG